MPRLSLDVRRKVILLHSFGFSVRKIKTRLSKENVTITQRSLYRLISKFQQANQYNDLYWRKREKKITPKMAIVMNNQLEENDKATARQLRSTLMEKYPALRVSLSTVKATHCSIPASILVSIDSVFSAVHQ